MEKKYEITVRELTPFTEEEIKTERRDRDFQISGKFSYADKPYHETRVLFAELSPEEWNRVKSAVLKEH